MKLYSIKNGFIGMATFYKAPWINNLYLKTFVFVIYHQCCNKKKFIYLKINIAKNF